MTHPKASTMHFILKNLFSVLLHRLLSFRNSAIKCSRNVNIQNSQNERDQLINEEIFKQQNRKIQFKFENFCFRKKANVHIANQNINACRYNYLYWNDLYWIR